jgi:Omp85 superfamily domain
MRDAMIGSGTCSSPHAARMRLCVLWLLCAGGATLPATSWSDPAEDTASQPAPVQPGTPAPAPSPNLPRWLNPATAPFLPVPLIGVDPNSGTTLGILPVRLQTDENHDISRIYAPDLYHNPYFGYGMHARVYDYPSADEQWSLVAGVSERVEREFDAEYQSGRLREQRWSYNASLVYDRSGTPRFYGIGNESLLTAETNYTDQEELAQVQVGFNLNQIWQLRYTGRASVVDVLPGTLTGVATLESRFGHILGVGTNDQLLNRLSIAYDTRDNLSAPTRGMEWVVYGGLASRRGVFNDSMYSETGVDGRCFWSINPDTIIAAHMALRYLPTAHRLPFWALSSIGGDQSEIGGDQPLRGYGTGRFYDRDSFSSTVEVRRRVWSFDAITTRVDLELAPFVDVGRVFSQTSTFPVTQLHPVGGLGIRGIARPFVVGYVDIGYGHEGAAVFTGLNYPF